MPLPFLRITLPSMSRAKPPLARLHELTPGQYADFFVLLAERSKSATRDGKPFYNCRFRDNLRTVSFKVWADGGWFDQCEKDWQEGHFYKVRGKYTEPPRFGPQIEIEQIRPVIEADSADGFDAAQFVEGCRRNADAMLAELKALAGAHIANERPIRTSSWGSFEAMPFVSQERDQCEPLIPGA